MNLKQLVDRTKSVVVKHSGKIATATVVIATEAMSASAAINQSWTDGMEAGGAAFSTGVAVFSNPPFNFILGVLVTIIVVLGVAKVIKRFM